MKLPSIQMLVNEAKSSFLRFPLTLLVALVGAVTAIYLVEYNSKIKNFFPYINLMLAAGLGIPLYLSVTIFSERSAFSKMKKWLLLGGVTLLLVVIYFTLPNADTTHNTALPYIKYAIYAISAHLIVAFIPYLPGTNLNGFWQYNKTLFIRFLLANLYSTVLYLGLILALTALRWLFDISIHNELYVELNIVILGIFNTWFFLSGIPEDFNKLDSSEEYPRELKVFAQFILLPLLVLYLLILYVYGGKIMLSWDWPKGIVSWLVICVSILGSLTFLLLYPYGKKEGNQWISKSSRIFYVMLVPLLFLLFIAVLMRIGDYGITIKRYVVLFLGLWLSLVCIYTIIGKVNIRFIPVSLSILLLLMSFGPWGMFSVSEHYQVKRMKNILEKANMLKDNKFVNEATVFANRDSMNFKNDQLLSDSLHNEVKSILDYMDDFHGFSAIRGWYRQDLDSIINTTMKNEKIRHYNEAELYMNAMGMIYEERDSESQSNYLNYSTSSNNQTIQNVTGYDYYQSFNAYYNFNDNYEITKFEIDSLEYTVNYHATSDRKMMLTIDYDNQQVSFPFDSLINKIYKQHNGGKSEMKPEELTMAVQAGKIQVEMRFSSIELKSSKGQVMPQNVNGSLYIRKNR